MKICSKTLSNKFKKKGRKCCQQPQRAADSFQDIPHSCHSSQSFIITSSFNEYSSTCCSLRYISICQKNKNTTTVQTLISWPTT